MTKLFVLLPLTILVLAGGNAVAAGKCARVFAEAGAKISAENQRYIDDSILALAYFRLDLDTQLAQGSRSIELTMLKADYLNKENELAQYLEMQKIMTREELIEQVKSKIPLLQEMKNKNLLKEPQDKDSDTQRQIREQEAQIRKSRITGRQAILHRVEPGSFKMSDNEVVVTITKPFEMMATQTTQIIWKNVLEMAVDKEINRNPDLELALDPSRFKGETHPVENIAWSEILEWVKILNQLSKKGEPGLSDLIAGHKKGDVYRLPTEAEWEFVVRGRGQLNKRYHFGDDSSQLFHYGWFLENSDGKTHPVAEKLPLRIGNKEFFDMYGNVQELLADYFRKDLPGGQDPVGKKDPNDPTWVIRGGSWMIPAENISSRKRDEWPTLFNKGSKATGFRLVREVRP